MQDDSSHSRLLPASPAVAEEAEGAETEEGEGGGFRNHSNYFTSGSEEREAR